MSSTTVQRSVTPLPDAEPENGSERAASERRWQCVCGQPYRVSGVDRHRIYWPIGAPVGEPVMDGCCVRCRRPLPGKHAHCREPS